MTVDSAELITAQLLSAHRGLAETCENLYLCSAACHITESALAREGEP